MRKTAVMLHAYNDTDAAWKIFGENDPYFGVAALDKFRKENLTAEALDEFFRSGDEYLAWLLNIIRAEVAPDFKPKRCLDFGCGVGRIAIPMATRFQSVVGLDVSDAMLLEAQKNCQIKNVRNIELLKSDDRLSYVTGKFDFIHSVIVFQHIPSARGEAITQRLIDLLEEGAVGALHYTYYQKLSLLQRFQLGCYRRLAFAYRLRCALKRHHLPVMQMNQYNLNTLFRIFQENNCHQISVRFTKADSDGAIFIFRKKKQVVY